MDSLAFLLYSYRPCRTFTSSYSATEPTNQPTDTFLYVLGSGKSFGATCKLKPQQTIQPAKEPDHQ
jgi:hypothetical protein